MRWIQLALEPKLRSGLSGLGALLLLTGCTSLSAVGPFGPPPVSTPLSPSYYLQSVGGHLGVMRAARPIDEWIADPATPARLRERLQLVREIREFASRELGLPNNGSYTRYADLQRPFVVWNVFATPELSMQLKQWCFPVAGCVSYRGYYSKQAAEDEAVKLRASGLEVQVAGIPAYSTLGWFDDPVLNTFIGYPPAELARLIFHELAHQVAYVKNDTAFNESFATAVEEIGVERWLKTRPDAALQQGYEAYRQRRTDFIALLKRYRMQLETMYAQSEGDEATKRQAKQALFKQMRADYEQLKQSWGGFAGYDRWFADPLTNAHFASVATYTEFVPGFRRMYAGQDQSLPRFFEAVRELAGRDTATRKLRLTEGLGGS